MIVVDASAVLDLLLRAEGVEAIEERLLAPGTSLHAPHLLDLEVAQALRRFERTGELAPARARQALADLDILPLHRHPHDGLLGRIWELRHAMTAYDAAYVALAEGLGAPLVTRDRRLAQARGHRARMEVV